MKNIVIFGIIALIAIVIFLSAKKLRKRKPQPSDNEPTPLKPETPSQPTTQGGKVINVESEDQFSQVINDGKICLVTFHSPNCGWCVKLMPTLDELAQVLGHNFIVAKVNVQNLPQLAGRFLGEDAGIPDIKKFKDGKMLDKGYNGDRSVMDLEKYAKS